MFSSWKSSEPKSEAKQRCGSEKNEDGWRSRKCDEQNVFLCERIEGMLAYSFARATDKRGY